MAEQGRRFTSAGGRPPQKKNSDQNGLWIAVIVLFCIGLWPIALGLMAYIWLSGDKNRQPEDRVQQARVKMDRTIDEALRRVSQTGGEADKTAQAARTEPDGQPRVVQAPQPSAADSAPRVRQAARKPRKPSGKAIDDKIKRALGGDGSRLRVIGIVLIVLSTLILAEPTDDLFYLGTIYEVEDLIVGLNFLIGGGALLGRGLYLRAFARRCRKYVTAIGKTDDMDIDLIARRVGRTYDQAVRDMDRMIDKGVLGDDAYLDLEQGCFLRYGSEGERRREEARAPKPDAVPPEAGEGFSGILRDIRAANDRIADPVLSAKIDRLEQITGQILKEVEEHPEKRARMGTFFDYYLPTTQKLLDTYADFEETGVEGENLRSAKQRIERTMDKIVEGFAQQLDSLFSADAMDVASDIKVMETMLERDTGSAARDFGYDKYQGEQQSSAN